MPQENKDVQPQGRVGLNVSMPQDMRDWLDAKAVARDTNASHIVRTIIRKEMNKEQEQK